MFLDVNWAKLTVITYILRSLGVFFSPIKHYCNRANNDISIAPSLTSPRRVFNGTGDEVLQGLTQEELFEEHPRKYCVSSNVDLNTIQNATPQKKKQAFHLALLMKLSFTSNPLFTHITNKTLYKILVRDYLGYVESSFPSSSFAWLACHPEWILLAQILSVHSVRLTTTNECRRCHKIVFFNTVSHPVWLWHDTIGEYGNRFKMRL